MFPVGGVQNNDCEVVKMHRASGIYRRAGHLTDRRTGSETNSETTNSNQSKTNLPKASPPDQDNPRCRPDRDHGLGPQAPEPPPIVPRRPADLEDRPMPSAVRVRRLCHARIISRLPVPKQVSVGVDARVPPVVALSSGHGRGRGWGDLWCWGSCWRGSWGVVRPEIEVVCGVC